MKKLWSINIFLHSIILNNILSKKLLDQIHYLFSTLQFKACSLLLSHLHILLVVMLICCGPRMNLTFILNCLIFKFLLEFMLKKIMLMMLQMLKLMMLLLMKLVMLLLLCFCNSITLQFVWITKTLMSVILILLMTMFFPILLFAINFLVIPRMMFLHLSTILYFFLIRNFLIILLFLKSVRDSAF